MVKDVPGPTASNALHAAFRLNCGASTHLRNYDFLLSGTSLQQNQV
jgi:hypothetical protein